MADQETQAASSPATQTDGDFSLYQKTENAKEIAVLRGELREAPAEKSAPEESATSETPKEAVTPAPEEGASPPAAEAGKPQEIPEKKGKSGAEQRILQLLAEKKQLQEQLANLKPAEPPKAVATPEATAGKPADPMPTEEDTNPDGTGKYPSYPDFVRALIKWEGRQEQARIAQETKKAEREKQGKEMVEGWQERVAEATKRHPDYAEVALAEDLPLPQGSVPDAYVLESEHGAEVLYYLGQHRDELDRISSLKDKWGNANPIAQVRELAKIEFSLSPNGQTPPVKKVTNAPRPIANLATGSTVPEDEEVAALKEGGESGFLKYQAAANARELRALRGR
jgi:hypothetical protein